jgi:hypothetical protein
MRLLRHYFISDNLDDLEVFEEQLEASGVTTPQIHVLSLHDQEVAHHDHLNYVQSFMKKDIIHSTELGAVVGVCVAAISLIVAYLAGWTESAAGWIPFIFLAIALLVFCTWEGGLIGVEKPNYHFARFSDALKNDKHIFFIDTEPNQEAVLNQVLQSHSQVELAGTGSATPHWLVVLEDKIPRFFKHTFP